MITYAGLMLIIILVLTLISYKVKYKDKDYLFFIFRASIIISLFINVGYVFKFKNDISYSRFMICYFVVISVFYLSKLRKSYQSYKKDLLYIGIFLFCILCGYLYISVFNVKTLIVSNSVSVDSIYYKTASLSKAKFNNFDLLQAIILCMFIYLCFLNKNYLVDKDKFSIIIKDLLFFCYVTFTILIIEYFVNNCIFPNLFRTLVLKTFGLSVNTYSSVKRFNHFMSMGLNREPSLCAVIFLVYLNIINFKKNWNTKDKVFFVLCLVSIFTTGSTTAILLIPYWIYIYFKKIWFSKKKKLYISITFIGILFASIVLYFIFSFNKSNNNIINDVLLKVKSYISHDKTSESGYVRRYGNDLCYNAFIENIPFGVGFGTTHGYGLIASLLSNIGILGIVSFIFAYKNMLYLSIKRKVPTFIINVIYCMFMIEPTAISSPLFIALTIYLNKNIDDCNI